MSIVQENYRDPGVLGSLGGVNQLKNAQSLIPSIKFEGDVLQAENAYTLYKPIKYVFKRDKMYVTCINQCWQMDLVDMQKYAEFNSNYNYILTIIDMFSRFGIAIPIKRKTGLNVISALEKAFKMRGYPDQVFTDQGLEFLQSQVRAYLIKNKIQPMTYTHGSVHAAMVERFNRTLREKLERLYHLKNSFNWINYLQKIVDTYNMTKSNSHGFRPVEIDEYNSPLVIKKLYPNGYELPNYKAHFKIGDTVRIARVKKKFEKGYTKKWSDEVFVVDHVIRKFKIYMYKIADLENNVIPGKFYKEQLQKVSPMIAAGVFNKFVEQKGDQVKVEWLWNGEKIYTWLPKDVFTTSLKELYLA